MVDANGDPIDPIGTAVDGTLTPVKTGQTVNFTAAPTINFGGTGTVSASATSTQPVTYSSNTTGVCTVNATSGLVTPVSAGTCTIAASQAGNATFDAASSTQNIVIGKGSQNIVPFGAAPSLTFLGGTATVNTTASSGLPITYGATAGSACTVNATTGVVTPTAGGSCTVTADQSGNNNFNGATQVTQTITVAKAAQTITFGAPPTLNFGGTATVTATASSQLQVSFSTTATPTICSVSGGTVTALAVGTCTVAGDQVGNGNYAIAPQKTQDITVNATAPGKPTVTATSGNTTATVTVTVSNNGGATVNGYRVTPTDTTTSTVLAVVQATASPVTVSGLTNGHVYTFTAIATNSAGLSSVASDASGTVTPSLNSQTVTFTTAPTINFGGTGTVSASASSQLAVTYSSNTTGVCTVNATSGLVTPVSAGTCTIAANQAGNATFGSASAIQSIVIGKGSQNIAPFGTAPALAFGGTATVTTTVSSGLPIAYGATTGSACTVNATTGAVTPTAAGSCTVTADQSGNTNYNAATQVTQTITVAKAAQTITFGAPPTLNFGGTATVSATSTSQLTVTFSATTTPTICSVSGATVTALAVGTCTVAGDQAGNGNYGIAPQKTQNITVSAIAPSKPTVSATPGNTTAIVTVTVSNNGGVNLTGYSVTPTDTSNNNTVGTPVQATASPVTVNGLTNGHVYTFTAIATNSAGLSSVASDASAAVTPNLLTPITGAPSAAVVKPGATVTYTVTYADAATITLADADITVNKTGSASGTAAVSGTGSSRTVTISGITGNGTLGISIAADTASNGNIHAQASAASATFAVDNLPPTLTVNALATNTVTSHNTFTVTGTVTDTNGIASVKVNGGAALDLGTGGSFNTSVTLVSGSNPVNVVATDMVGNVTTDSRNIVLDSTKPTITFGTPTPTDGASTNLQSVTIAGTLSEAGSVAVAVNGGNPVSADTSGANNSFSVTVTLALGPNTLVIVGGDKATPPNTTTVQRTATFDTTAPTLSITDPSVAITTSLDSYLVKGTVTDNFVGATVTFSVDGVAVSPAPTVATDGTFQQSVPMTDAKTYHVTVTATDKAGNTTAQPVQRNIVHNVYTIADALRALRIAAQIDTQTAADVARLDVGPLVDGKPAQDGKVDLSDAIVVLRLVVHDLNGVTEPTAAP